jgi:hypothetical protein
MRMPKAARAAFGGEMRFVPSMAQVHLLSPSGSFLRERPFQKHVPTVGPPRRPGGDTTATACSLNNFEFEPLNGSKL